VIGERERAEEKREENLHAAAWAHFPRHWHVFQGGCTSLGSPSVHQSSENRVGTFLKAGCTCGFLHVFQGNAGHCIQAVQHLERVGTTCKETYRLYSCWKVLHGLGMNSKAACKFIYCCDFLL
jgi:hypothetical protein